MKLAGGVIVALYFLCLVPGLFLAGRAEAAATGVTLAASPRGSQPTGVEVVFSAKASGDNPSYQYKFQRKISTDTDWTTVRAYRVTETWKWNTTGAKPGEYRVRVLARATGSTAPYEVRRSIRYTLTAPVAATGVTLTRTPRSPSKSGTAVTFTAQASGGDGVYQYKYQWKLASESAWTLGRAFSTARKWKWNTSGLAPGIYRVRVIVHTVDTSSASNVLKTVGHKLTPRAPLPDTGQTACYDAVGDEAVCAGSGQDGAYTLHPPAYTNNGNGTVTDNVTRLVWQRRGDGFHGSWDQAQAYCDNLTLGGQTDWRLPTRRELISIVDYGRYDPAIDTKVFAGTLPGYYWSSVSFVNDPDSYYWRVYFPSGYVDYGHKSEEISARCVRRGEWGVNDFVVNPDATVTDLATGLIWKRGHSTARWTWAQALDHCEQLSFAGFDDWRLPNIRELESITATDRYYGAIDESVLPILYGYRFWSSTSFATYAVAAWLVDFFDGRVDADGGTTQRAQAWCVRGGQ